MKRLLFTTLILIMCGPISSSRGEVGDPTLRTDHPQYAGEGAFQTAADCVRFATEGKTMDQDRAIALYLWLLTHQFHLMSPQEWCVPGQTPDTNKSQEDSQVWDAARSRFSYGYGLCGTVHAWNEAYWRELGMPARRRAFPGHTNSEVFYGGGWHAFDTDMAGLLFRRDGVVAGYDDLIRDPSLADSVRPPLPHYPFAWPGDFDGMKAGWQEVAKAKTWFSLYNGGYEAQPGIVQLRPGETFTRWFDPDHFGGPKKRRFWHHQKDGPFRDWTFVNNGEPKHDGDKANARGNAAYCNGEFVYEPEFTSDRFRDGVELSTNVKRVEDSPQLRSADGGPAKIVLRHFSPYVICGDPADDANPMSGKATDGLMISGKLVGEVMIELSVDEGQTWEMIEPTTLPLDLTDRVKGRYGWRMSFSWTGEAGIDALKFTTTTQVNQTIYPRLKPDGTQVTYRNAARGVVAVLPDFAMPDGGTDAFEDVSRRSPNVAYRGRGANSRLAYQTTNNKPGQIVFPVRAPAPLVEVRAAIRYSVRVPPPEGHDFRLEVSTDQGKTWTGFARAEIPNDNEHSSGWLAGSAKIAAANVRAALVRATLYAGGYQTGLLDAQFYGIYRTGDPEPLAVKYGWLEDGKARTQTEAIAAGAREHSWSIATGKNVRDQFVRLAVGESPAGLRDDDEKNVCEEPATSGDHAARLKSLADNTWIDLGAPAADAKWGRARGRAWTSRMPYAAYLQSAFLYGEGVHGWANEETGRYMDDLWLYEVREHRWKCLWPGTDVSGKGIHVNDDGFEANADGKPLPIAALCHGYAMSDYSSVDGTFYFMPCMGGYETRALPWRKPMLAQSKVNESHASPWSFDMKSDQWSRKRTEQERPPSSFGDALVYVPTLKKFWFRHMGGEGLTALYDPQANTWETVEPKGPKPPFGIDVNVCYDPTRDQIYVGGGQYPVAPGAALWIFDLKSLSWVDPKPTGAPGVDGHPYGAHNAIMNYDTVNDKLVLIRWSDPAEVHGVHVYDPKQNRWSTATRELPWPADKWNTRSGFYDPKSNTHFVFAAGDSNDNGTMFAYRLAK